MSHYQLGFLAVVLILNCHTGYAYHVGEKPAETRGSTSVPRIIRLTSSIVEFATMEDEPVRLAIYDVRGNLVPNNGQVIQTLQPVNGQGMFQLNIAGQASGVYFITLSNRFGIRTIGVVDVR